MCCDVFYGIRTRWSRPESACILKANVLDFKLRSRDTGLMVSPSINPPYTGGPRV